MPAQNRLAVTAACAPLAVSSAGFWPKQQWGTTLTNSPLTSGIPNKHVISSVGEMHQSSRCREIARYVKWSVPFNINICSNTSQVHESQVFAKLKNIMNEASDQSYVTLFSTAPNFGATSFDFWTIPQIISPAQAN